jgi:adenine deaminase
MIRLLLTVFCLTVVSVHVAIGQEQSILIKNGILINGLGQRVTRGQDILIENGKISRIGKHLKPPGNTRRIQARGKTIIPGLIDMHGHMYAFGKTQTEAYPLLYLAGGVTTLYSPGEFEPANVLALKTAIQQKQTIGPTILFAGPYFDTRGSSLSWTSGLADTIAIMNQLAQWKDSIDGIKVYANVSKEHFDFILTKAKQYRLPVTGHLGTISTRYAVEQGITGLEHGLLAINDFGSDPLDFFQHFCHMAELDLGSPEVLSLVDLIVHRKVYVDPTLSVFESILPAFQPLTDSLPYFLDERALREYTAYQSTLKGISRNSCLVKAFEKQMAFTALIHTKGGLLVAGTDPVSPDILPGLGMKREIKLLIEKANIPLEQAIRIASYNGAVALGIPDKTGSIEAGKAADLSIINGDLTKNIEFLNHTFLVIKEGHLYNPQKLYESAKGKITAGSWEFKD